MKVHNLKIIGLVRVVRGLKKFKKPQFAIYYTENGKIKLFTH